MGGGKGRVAFIVFSSTIILSLGAEVYRMRNLLNHYGIADSLLSKVGEQRVGNILDIWYSQEEERLKQKFQIGCLHNNEVWSTQKILGTRLEAVRLRTVFTYIYHEDNSPCLWRNKVKEGGTIYSLILHVLFLTLHKPPLLALESSYSIKII